VVFPAGGLLVRNTDNAETIYDAEKMYKLHAMKCGSILLLLVLLTHAASATIIPVGFGSKKVNIWRYWEINNEQIPEAKMLVYNKTDSAIRFCMIRQRNDTIVKTVTILPHEYGIYAIESVPADSKDGSFDELFINGLRIGMSGVMRELKLTKFEHRYYSKEGAQGTGLCMVGKDELFSKRGRKEKMTLYFDCTPFKHDVNNMQLVPLINSGFKSMTLFGEDGVAYAIAPDTSKAGMRVDKAKTKTGVPVAIRDIDSYQLEVEYTIAKNEVWPDFNIRVLFANNNIGEAIPIIAK
jgi:hypothetical protein